MIRHYEKLKDEWSNMFPTCLKLVDQHYGIMQKTRDCGGAPNMNTGYLRRFYMRRNKSSLVGRDLVLFFGKILDIQNYGGFHTTQNYLRTALLTGGGHGGRKCFNKKRLVLKNYR